VETEYYLKSFEIKLMESDRV